MIGKSKWEDLGRSRQSGKIDEGSECLSERQGRREMSNLVRGSKLRKLQGTAE